MVILIEIEIFQKKLQNTECLKYKQKEVLKPITHHGLQNFSRLTPSCGNILNIKRTKNKMESLRGMLKVWGVGGHRVKWIFGCFPNFWILGSPPKNKRKRGRGQSRRGEIIPPFSRKWSFVSCLSECKQITWFSTRHYPCAPYSENSSR